MSWQNTGLPLIWPGLNSQLGSRSSSFLHTHDLCIWLLMVVRSLTQFLYLCLLVFPLEEVYSVGYSMPYFPSILCLCGGEYIGCHRYSLLFFGVLYTWGRVIPCFHVITFQRRVVSWMCSLLAYSLFKEEWFFRCESSYTYNFVMLFQNIEDPNIEISSWKLVHI